MATFIDTNPDTTAGQYTATINWGDGTSSAGAITAFSGPPGGFGVQGTHRYATASPSGGDVLSVTVIRDAQHTATGSGTATVADSAPTVATAATASPSPVTGTTTALSVLGADYSGESSLTYTWVTTGAPPGAIMIRRDTPPEARPFGRR